MPLISGIFIVAAVLAAAIFFVGLKEGCTLPKPVINGEVPHIGWGRMFRAADAVVTGRVAGKLGSIPVPPWERYEESRLVETDYQIDVARFLHPLSASDRTIAVTELEVSPEYRPTTRLFHSIDLAEGQRGLFFLSRIPLDQEALQAGELEMGHYIPEGFSHHNHYSLLGAFRFQVACVV